MAFDFSSPTVKAWFANKDNENYAVNAVSKWALKPEFANAEGVAKLTRLMTIATQTSLVEQGNTYYTFSNDLWDAYSFWCEEQWATKTDFLTHVSPEGAFGRVWGNFSALTTSQVAFYKDVSPVLSLRMLDSEAAPSAPATPPAVPAQFNPLELFAPVTSDANCWYFPKPGTERCPIQMNMAWNDPRVEIYLHDHMHLNIQHVDVVTKWTLKNANTAAKSKWSRLMRTAQTASMKEKGCQIYKWGQDAFDEDSFWLFEKWASKGDQIAHVTTGYFGRTKAVWFKQATGLLAMFSALQVAPVATPSL